MRRIPQERRIRVDPKAGRSRGRTRRSVPSQPQINPSRSKPHQIAPSKNAWFYLVLFVQIAAFQWVTVTPNKKSFPVSHCVSNVTRLPVHCSGHALLDRDLAPTNRKHYSTHSGLRKEIVQSASHLGFWPFWRGRRDGWRRGWWRLVAEELVRSARRVSMLTGHCGSRRCMIQRTRAKHRTGHDAGSPQVPKK